jgi:lisH domain-containing protein FOPNL
MLSDCIKEKLEFDGKLRKIKSEMKKYVFDILNEEFSKTNKEQTNLNSNNFILNELICEYLKFNNYEHALHVFLEESGQPKYGVGRKTLASELNVEESSNARKIPLLYSLVNFFTSGQKSTF